ncbi:hypothetical protein [Butyrivibrio proteoclasticus]|uniref:hypothetical protein n=1 Tax=Butyrivibrio proteoclasticus TaxID=43305 RepID=UPI00047D8812|nr:hypothetical protein [Butyrivibrio proteoclasticus]
MQEENKDKKASPLYSEFAYDDAYRTMETECDDIVIPFVNYFYNENYDNTAKITRLRNEHYIEHADQSDEKRITDSHFKITQNDVSKTYHFECESKPYDNSILVRMFEYDSQTALDESKSEGNILRVRFPYAGLLLLRKSLSSPDRAEVIIETPKGEVSYDIKIIKISDFSIDSIFENHLYLMIPFYIFNYESEFKSINEDAERTEDLADVFRNIMDRLDEELEKGNLSALSHNVIIRLTHKVVYKLTMKHNKVQDKVGGIMGGKVLDLPDIKVFHEGKAEGKAEGRAEGLKEGEAERKKLADKNTKLEDENASLKAELEKLKRQMK